MASKKENNLSTAELDAAKLEAMRLRFRRVLGESVSSHVIKNARKNISKCVKSLQNNEVRNA